LVFTVVGLKEVSIAGSSQVARRRPEVCPPMG
jgi:hypothetical protein